MNPFKSLVVAIALSCAACLASPARPTDVVLATSPDVAASGAYLVEALGISKPVWIGDDDGLAEQGLLGESFPGEDSYVVLLRSDLGDVEKWTVLEHELAHVLVWDSGVEDSSAHGPAWGVAMARVHRTAVHEVTSLEDTSSAAGR